MQNGLYNILFKPYVFSFSKTLFIFFLLEENSNPRITTVNVAFGERPDLDDR